MKTCVLCKEEFEGYGNNAQPLADGICCDLCNDRVIYRRLTKARARICHFCGEKDGSVSICDEEGKSYEICEECDDNAEWKK